MNKENTSDAFIWCKEQKLKQQGKCGSVMYGNDSRMAHKKRQKKTRAKEQSSSPAQETYC